MVGFGKNGVYVSLSTDTGFGPVNLWTSSYSYDRGWRTNTHPRFVEDVNGDEKADIIGFSSVGVYVSLSDGKSFKPAVQVLDTFSYNKGWRNNFHPRFVKDVNGDYKADIIGFSSIGVFISLEVSDPKGDFQKDTTLPAGTYHYDTLNIPAGVTVTFTGDVTIIVSGDINIAGALIGNCGALSLLGNANITITGEVNNSCSDPNNSNPGDLIIQTDGGQINIGTLTTQATIDSSGNIDINNDPSLEDWEFDVLPDQRSPNKLAPVCSATSDTLYDSVAPGSLSEVSFFAEGADPDGGSLGYSWDFGDNQTANEQNPDHSYSSAGVFDVTVTVTDDDNQRCTATLRIVIDDETNIPEVPALWIEPDFLVTEVNQELGFTSVFDDPQGQDVTYRWDFGDGGSSSEASPSHTYRRSGRYEVSLEITDTDNNVSTAKTSVYAYLRLFTLNTADLTTAQVPANACIVRPAGYGVFNAVFDGGKAAEGQKGKSQSRTVRGNLIIAGGADIKIQDGGDGKSKSGNGYVRAKNGRIGGSLTINVRGNLVICGGARLATGDGGDGGKATATGTARAQGGNGGPAASRLRLKATGQLIFQAGITTLEPGNGGDGGEAVATGDPGADGCPEGKPGKLAKATGGKGGNASKVAFGNATGIGNIRVQGGDGGKGGKGDATGGKGGNSTCPGPSKGGDGGKATAQGGVGGNSTLINLAGLLNNPFTAGDGGDAVAEGGKGGDGFGSCKPPVIGGNGGNGAGAKSTGGDPGQGTNPGQQGTAKATGGNGGNGGDGLPPGLGGAGAKQPNDVKAEGRNPNPKNGTDGQPGDPCPIIIIIIFYWTGIFDFFEGVIDPGSYIVSIGEETKTDSTVTMTVPDNGSSVMREGDLLFIEEQGKLDFDFNNVQGEITSFKVNLDPENNFGGEVELRGYVNGEVVATDVVDVSEESVLELENPEGFDRVTLDAADAFVTLPEDAIEFSFSQLQ